MNIPNKFTFRYFIQLIQIHKKRRCKISRLKLAIVRNINQKMNIEEIEQQIIKYFGSNLEQIHYYNNLSSLKGRILLERYLNGYKVRQYDRIAMLSIKQNSKVIRRHIYKKGLDIQIIQRCVEQSNKVMVMIDEIIDEKIRFWNRLLEGYSSMKQFLKEVNYLGTKILKCRKFVDKNYDQNKKILRPGQSSDILTLKTLEIYSMIVFNRFDQRIDKIMKQKLEYDDLQINDKSLWLDQIQILSMNLSSRVMKYENQMPSFLQDIHEQLIDDFIDRNESQLFYNSKFTFYLDDNMFILPCCLNLCQPLIEDSLILYMFKRQLDLNNNYVIFTINGIIHGMSKILFELMDPNISIGTLYQLSNIQIHIPQIFNNFQFNQIIEDRWLIPIDYSSLLLDKSLLQYKFINIQYQLSHRNIQGLVDYYILEIIQLNSKVPSLLQSPPLQVRQQIQYIPSDSGQSLIPDDLQSQEIESESNKSFAIKQTVVPQFQFYNPPLNNSSFRSQSLRKPLFNKPSQIEYFDQDIKIIEEEIKELDYISKQEQNLKEKQSILKKQQLRDNHHQFTIARSLISIIQKIYSSKKTIYLVQFNKFLHILLIIILPITIIILIYIILDRSTQINQNIQNISQPLLLNHLFLKIIFLQYYDPSQIKELYNQLITLIYQSSHILDSNSIQYYFHHLANLLNYQYPFTPSPFRDQLSEFFEINEQQIKNQIELTQQSFDDLQLFFFIIALLLLLPEMLIIIIQLKHWITFSNTKYQVLNLISRVSEWQAQNQIYKLTLYKAGLQNWKNTDFYQLSKSNLAIEEKVSVKKGHTNLLLNQRINNHNLRSYSVLVIFTLFIMMLNIFYFLGYGMHMRSNQKYQPYININTKLVFLQFRLDNVIFLGDLIKQEPHYLNISLQKQQQTINMFLDYTYYLDEHSILLLKDLSDIGPNEISNIFNENICEQDLNLTQCNNQYYNRGIFGYISTLTLLIQLEYSKEIKYKKYDNSSWEFLNSTQHEVLFSYYYKQFDKVMIQILSKLQEKISELSDEILNNLTVYYALSGTFFSLIYFVVVFKLILKEQKQFEILKQALVMVPPEKLHFTSIKKQVKLVATLLK